MMCWILLSSQLGKLSVWRRWMPLSNRRQILLHSKPSHGQREHREKRTSCLMQGKWGRKHFSFISNTIPTFMKSNPSLLFHPCLFGYVISVLLAGAWQEGRCSRWESFSLRSAGRNMTALFSFSSLLGSAGVYFSTLPYPTCFKPSVKPAAIFQ